MPFNGAIHYETTIHENASNPPVGRHDYEAFATASQFPDGLLVVKNGTVFRWSHNRNEWRPVMGQAL